MQLEAEVASRSRALERNAANQEQTQELLEALSASEGRERELQRELMLIKASISAVRADLE